MLSSDASSGCEFFWNSRNDSKLVNLLACPWRTWFRMLKVFFRIFYHPLYRFLQCDRLNTMAQCEIIPYISIIASNFPKWDKKAPHMTLLFLRTSIVNLLMVFKEYPMEDVSSVCYFFRNSRNDRKLVKLLACPWRTWFRILGVFFLCILSPPSSFPAVWSAQHNGTMWNNTIYIHHRK